jgi:nitronate monooxygenase
MGTRFTATRESLWDQAMKDAALAAGGDQTQQTRAFDVVRGALWPAIYPGRALRNDFSARWHGQEDALAADQSTQEKAYLSTADNDFGTRVVWAGGASISSATFPPHRRSSSVSSRRRPQS